MSWNKTVHSGLPSEIGDDFFYLHFLLLLPDELLFVEESGLEGRHLALFGHQLVVLHCDGLGHAGNLLLQLSYFGHVVSVGILNNKKKRILNQSSKSVFSNETKFRGMMKNHMP